MPYLDKDKGNAVKKQRYQANKEKWAERQRQLRKRIKEYIWDIKSKSKCCKCGVNHPAVLDFHHRDPSQKDAELADMMKNKWSIERILIELAKCDVMCANCHRLVHYELDNCGL